MKKIIAINGSPRKGWNTDKLLQSALKGAEDAGAETKIIHLYDLNFRDCKSCLVCKLKGNKTDGICAIRDDLKSVYEEIFDADGLIIGSPIYYSNLTGETISFINRLLFPLRHYEDDGVDYMKKKKNCGLIITLNGTEEIAEAIGFPKRFDSVAQELGMYIGGECETLFSYNTYQFTDYSKYYADFFDEKEKAKQREEQFPIDLKKAYTMGVKIATEPCIANSMTVLDFLQHESMKYKSM